MAEPDYPGAIAYALQRLHSELPPDLIYHNLWHTEQDVLPAVVLLGRMSDLAEQDVQQLRVAAAFHDIGFVFSGVEHERAGAAMASQVLPGYRFDPAAIDRITGMIMATKLPQSPRDLAEAVLADADLDVLGRPDFLTRNAALRQELAVLGRPMTDREWLTGQRAFLTQHSYFTPAAAALRNAGKQVNLTVLATQLQELG